ncbi:hypothetical protein GBAR_LOCUS14789 [Geodia barretti]|uniref:Uncharacterized protein n=1 Tax=Geodia barretti TaxID=519541 RepID=A0AA35S8X4_GEOBA|nr:hypothetical protein GBAR_LOCUS14789 [Geodia barretti]
MPRLKSILILAIVTIVAVTAGLSLSQDATAQGSPGTATISDDQALSDSITYTMNVPPPSEGTEYVGWLLSDDGSVKLSTGPMERLNDGSIMHTFDRDNSRYTGENLIQGYDKVAVTEEAAGTDPSEPGGPVVFSSQIPMGAAEHIRAIVGDGSPADGIRTQLAEALQMARTAQSVSSLADAKNYLEGVVNMIEGSSADIDGNGSVNNPAMRTEILHNAEPVIDSAIAAGAAGAGGAGRVEAGARHAHESAGMARDEAVIAINAATQVLARLAAGGAAGFLDGALTGTPESGGASKAYVAASDDGDVQSAGRRFPHSYAGAHGYARAYGHAYTSTATDGHTGADPAPATATAHAHASTAYRWRQLGTGRHATGAGLLGAAPGSGRNVRTQGTARLSVTRSR